MSSIFFGGNPIVIRTLFAELEMVGFAIALPTLRLIRIYLLYSISYKNLTTLYKDTEKWINNYASCPTQYCIRA